MSPNRNSHLGVIGAFVVVLLCLPATSAAQCNFDVSVYADGWVTENYLNIQFVASGYDNSPYCGCYHVSYGSLTISGVFADTQEFSQSFQSWYDQEFAEGFYNYSADITIYCWCVMGPVYAGYAGGAVQAQSPTCGDERDNIIQEYRNYGVNLVPSCTELTSSGGNSNWPWVRLNDAWSEGSLHSPWGLIKPRLLTELDATLVYYNRGEIWLEGAYRCPHGNANAGGVTQSRHMRGLAADLFSFTYPWTENEFNLLKAAAGQTIPAPAESLFWDTYPVDHHFHVAWP
jgi:peptidase M15-like protein